MMAREAMSLAARGIKIVRLYGIRPDGSCACWKGRDCGDSTGKHPVGTAWQEAATDDEEEIASWFEDASSPINIGILLGPTGGVIDIETDGPDGESEIEKWGLHEVDTPVFRSGRGLHRLFQWEDDLPEIASTKNIKGIEVRLGGGGMAAQSVVPPSRHKSGTVREWLSGKSPEDIPVAKLPEKFKREIIAKAGGASTGRAAAARAATAAGTVFYEGEGRHPYLHGEALDQAWNSRRLESAETQECIHQRVLALNETRCIPPYPEKDVRKKVDDAIDFTRKNKTSESANLDPRDPHFEEKLAALRDPWERAGLVKDPERSGCYLPGSWRLTIWESNPREFVLSGVRSRDGSTSDVRLTPDEFLSPTKTARAILATTGDVDMTNPNLSKWSSLWLGGSKKEDRDKKGLKASLLEQAEKYRPSADEQTHAVHAAWLLDYLQRFRKPEVADADDNEPSPSGSPRWLIIDGQAELWFRWEDSVKKAAEQARNRIEAADIRDLSRRIRRITGEAEFRSESRHLKRGGARRYVVWTEQHIAAVEQLAGVESAQR